MGRPVRTFPCRIICYSPLPLTQHPRHAAEVLSALRQRTLFGSSASSSTTTKAQQSSDQRQHIWNANSLPSTQNTAKPASDIIVTPRHFTILGPLGFPFGTVANFDEKQWVCQGIDRHKNCLSSYGAVGSVTACPPHYQVFQLYYPLMKFTGIGVAATALEKLHLFTTFIFRGRGLLNLSEPRSEVLYTIPYSFFLFFDKPQSREYDNAKSAKLQSQQRPAAHCHLGNTPLQSLFSLYGFLGKRITTQATSASSSTIPTTIETSVNTNVTFPFSYFHLPPSLFGSVLL